MSRKPSIEGAPATVTNVIYLAGMTQTIALVLALAVLQTAPTAGTWKSLFDGKSLEAWRIFKTDKAPTMCDRPGAKDCWEIVDGVLQKDGHANDIASKEQFGDFELELEWNIGNASNSGVFYRGTDAFEQIYWSAPEYQLLDNQNAADNKQDNHLAGRCTTCSPFQRLQRSLPVRGIRRASWRRASTSSIGSTVRKSRHTTSAAQSGTPPSRRASSRRRNTRISAGRRRATSAYRAIIPGR